MQSIQRRACHGVSTFARGRRFERFVTGKGLSGVFFGNGTAGKRIRTARVENVWDHNESEGDIMKVLGRLLMVAGLLAALLGLFGLKIFNDSMSLEISGQLKVFGNTIDLSQIKTFWDRIPLFISTNRNLLIGGGAAAFVVGSILK